MGVYNHLDLTAFAGKVLMTTGLSRERAQLMAETLVMSDLMGHTTHGLQLLLPYTDQLQEGQMTISGEPEIIADHGAVLTWNGRHLPGPYLVQRAIDTCLERIETFGQVTVAIGDSHHIACLAAYLEQVTSRNLMIVLMSSDPGNQTVAPFGGLTGTHSPDPIAYGIPTLGTPILFDSSASLIANGVVMQQHAQEEMLSGPWLMDAEGRATDDPAAFFADPPATILPVGGLELGFKGFGYALLVEALTSGLSGTGRKEEKSRWSASVYVQVTNPTHFGGQEAFLRETQYLVDRCLASQPRTGFNQVRMPGQRAIQLRDRQIEEGLKLHPQVIRALYDCAVKYKVTMVEPI